MFLKQLTPSLCTAHQSVYSALHPGLLLTVSDLIAVAKRLPVYWRRYAQQEQQNRNKHFLQISLQTGLLMKHRNHQKKCNIISLLSFTIYYSLFNVVELRRKRPGG